jgi:phosphoesterase RecJ-like protein
MKLNCRFEEIAEVLRTRERFLVLSHMHPDGDALGSELAMGLCLRQLGKDVTIWNEDGVPEKFRYLPKYELISKPPAEPQDFDVVLLLDTAVQNRAGTCLAAVRHAGLWINIDHHISNDHYGDLAYIDAAAPATGQVLHEFFKSQGFPITYEMADNLFAAISTDTGSFCYPSTTARTYEIGAELIKLGVNVGQLSQKMYESYPRRRLELLRALLNALRFGVGNRSVSFSLSLATAQALKVQPDDTEGLIDTIRAVQGVIVAAFFEELPEGRVRISLRSKDPRVDVCKICAQFGGGGHTLASGARLHASLAEAEDLVHQAIDQAIAAANL